MKLKLFEDVCSDDGPINFFYDGDLKITMSYGTNSGKIIIISFNSTYSLMLGCAIILDSKYEKMSQVRNIKNCSLKYRIVTESTLDCILNDFVSDMDEYTISSYSDRSIFSYEHKKLLKDTFKNKIENITVKSKNFGEILDGLREVRYEFFEFQRLTSATNKYNL